MLLEISRLDAPENKGEEEGYAKQVSDLNTRTCEQRIETGAAELP